ncbi:MAG TPA: TOBE domain-containing protein [Bacteroidota bacterium]|nr:TOBE domain-containing protein [Bacteroidota bacterium]
MNQLKGRISNIQQSGGMMLVDVDVEGKNFSALMIDAQHMPVWMREGNSIGLIFKETEVSLGKKVTGKLSLRNQLPCIVKSVKRGAILSVVKLKFDRHIITSAITTRSADMLKIKSGNRVTAFIKANEMTLTELKA